MKKLDVLNRNKSVDDLMRVMENISDNKASTCFALNGIWGSGKSFVLDMFEEKLSEIQSEETFTDNWRKKIISGNKIKYNYCMEEKCSIFRGVKRMIEEVMFLRHSAQQDISI